MTTDSPLRSRVSRWARKLDAVVGNRVEQAVTAHHRRRLARLGHSGALATPAGGWASGPPPCPGNSFEVLVDGAEALPEIAGTIESARVSVWLAGWYFSPDFRLRRDRAQTLGDLLAAAAERGVDVRLLGWAGAPLPLFHPDRREVQRATRSLEPEARIRVALDSKERPLHCHHEKLVIVDGGVAFVGGIDLTSYGGDRFDARGHPARPSVGWHDATSRLRGPAVADVVAHFRLRWLEVTGDELPRPSPPIATGDVELQVVRTVPERIYAGLPRGDFTILESYLRALRSAQRLASGSLCCCQPSRTTATTTRAASSASSPMPTAARDASLPARCTRTAASDPCTSTRRSGSSTTRGSRSDRRTSTSTRSSTTPS